MVPRYSRKEMVDIWSDDSKYSIWLDIEVYALEGMELVGIVPKGTAKVVREKATFNTQSKQQIQSEIKHDVLAFLTNNVSTIALILFGTYVIKYKKSGK